MTVFLPTIILRHRRENLKKCSLRGLEQRPDFQFFTYPSETPPPLHNYITLSLDAPPLSEADGAYGLFLIDATWKYAAIMLKQVQKRENLIYRSIPKDIRTAYPRKQTDCGVDC